MINPYEVTLMRKTVNLLTPTEHVTGAEESCLTGRTGQQPEDAAVHNE